MKSAYKAVTTYHFGCAGESWAITEVMDDYLYIEETRKNGQEDTHMSLGLYLIDGKWVPDDDLGEWHPIVSWCGMETVNRLVAYVNEHGPPV